MKKRLMRVETNASFMFVTYDPEEKIARVLDTWETQGHGTEESPFRTRLEDVEDDSSWNIYEGIEDIETWLNIDYSDPDGVHIIEEIETDI